jgi:spore maturation protein CgeB
MIRRASIKRTLRRVPAVAKLSHHVGARRFDNEYRRAVLRYQAGSMDYAHHLNRLHQSWQPRRYLSDPQQARVVLVCMETWEVRSLIPPVLNYYDAVHIPICDTSDYSVYSAQQERVIEEFQRAEKAAPVDLVLVYATNAQVASETLRKMRRHGALVAVMCLDDKQSFEDHRPTREWPAGQLPLIGSAHIHLTNSRECLRWYDSHNASALHWPAGANTDFGYHQDVEQDIDVSFVGQGYGARLDFITRLRQQGIRVSCFGSGWENPFVSDEEMFRIFARSKINLGFGYVGYSNNITCLKGRDFDVPGSGNFYLTTYDAELAECFKVGEEIACYRNEVECAELVQYYLDNPGIRQSIALAGRRRVLNSHTWECRLQSLMELTGIIRGVLRGGGESPDSTNSFLSETNV